MRVIIAGSRNINIAVEYLSIIVMNAGFVPSVIMSGNARGADKLGELWANIHDISCEKYPADWDKYGKSAGYKRNELMASNADALIALWDGDSHGTKHMIDIAAKYNLPTYVWRTDDNTGTITANNKIQVGRDMSGMVCTNAWGI